VFGKLLLPRRLASSQFGQPYSTSAPQQRQLRTALPGVTKELWIGTFPALFGAGLCVFLTSTSYKDPEGSLDAVCPSLSEI